jgi:proteasome lid subunit RPN8/RPN11
VDFILEELASTQIEAHLAEDPTAERVGVLAGRLDGTTVTALAALPARRAQATASSITFTHEVWDEISQGMAALYPDLTAVGWYHSRPGRGASLSEYDRFICSTYFPEAWQFAYVVDPRSGQSAVFFWQGDQLVPAQPPTQADPERLGPASGAAGPPDPPRLRPPARRGVDRRIIVGAAVTVAVLLFVAGYLTHDTSPGHTISYRTTYDSGALVLQASVSEHGSTAQLTETFSEANRKGSLSGTVTPCVPSGSVLGTYLNLKVVTPDSCVLDLTSKHPTATITASGPAATILSGIGPGTFRGPTGLSHLKVPKLSL